MSKAGNLSEYQRRVLNTLDQAKGALSAYDILARLGSGSPIQVYRALDKLISLDAVHRLESINAYMSCCQKTAHDPGAFAICDQCGHIDEVVDTSFDTSLEAQLRNMKFKPDYRVLEIHGLCANCAREH